MHRAGGGDVEQASVVRGVGPVPCAGFDDDHVVELQTLDLVDLDDIDTGGKGELLLLDETDVLEL